MFISLLDHPDDPGRTDKNIVTIKLRSLPRIVSLLSHSKNNQTVQHDDTAQNGTQPRDDWDGVGGREGDKGRISPMQPVHMQAWPLRRRRDHLHTGPGVPAWLQRIPSSGSYFHGADL